MYRSYYRRRGKHLNYAYDGIEELLIALKDMGCKLAVCTSKYEPFAKEIVEILELSQYFRRGVRLPIWTAAARISAI